MRYSITTNLSYRSYSSILSNIKHTPHSLQTEAGEADTSRRGTSRAREVAQNQLQAGGNTPASQGLHSPRIIHTPHVSSPHVHRRLSRRLQRKENRATSQRWKSTKQTAHVHNLREYTKPLYSISTFVIWQQREQVTAFMRLQCTPMLISSRLASNNRSHLSHKVCMRARACVC